MKYIVTDSTGVLLRYGEAGTRTIARQQVVGDEMLFEIDQNSGMLQCEELVVEDGALVAVPGTDSPIGEGTEVTQLDL